MDNDWTREIERLTDLLKKSEEEMLLWRREHRDAQKEIARLKKELADIEAEYRSEYGKLARALGTKAAENADLKARLAPIEAVYEKYQDQDKLLSDELWIVDAPPSRECVYDLWAAIKEAEHES